MRRVAAVVAAVVVMAAGSVCAAGGAGAQTCTGYPEPTLDPTSGPAGTTVTVSVGADTSQCVPRPQPIENTDAFVTIGPASQTAFGSAWATAAIAADGSWSTTWQVPANQPAGPVTLYATAWIDFGAPVVNGAVTDGSGFEIAQLDYQPLVFQVTVPPTTTTTTTAAPTTSTTAAPSSGIRVSDADLLPGEGFTVYGSGFQPGATVEVYLESTPVLLGTAVADAVGDVEATVAVPAGFAAGPHTVRLVGAGIGGGVLNLSVGVTVGSLVADVAPPPAEATAAPQGELPRTGGLPVGALAAGMGLVLAGVAVLRLREVRARA